MTSRLLPAIGAVMLAAASIGRLDPPAVAAIHTNAESRTSYLAHTVIWRDPGALSPRDLLEGPVDALPYPYEKASSDEGIACTFAQPGKDIGGNSPKFLCRTAEGRDLRVKYWNPSTGSGNHELFATVAASRLMWALGFNAIPAQVIDVQCDACPENPQDGVGRRESRRYIGMLQAPWPTPVILSGANVDQGWSWRELDTAIGSLPPGPERTRQRIHFDALTLLGVFMQHGDRKSEQQRLYCVGPVNLAAGELASDTAGSARVLLERPGTSACTTSAVTIADTGATFGSAGRTSAESTAKMNLDAWRHKRVFREPATGECVGELTVSLKAGRDGDANPLISEAGRRFFLEQMHRLTPTHVKAIFTAAHVDQLSAGSPESPRQIDAWVAAFEDKVRQIEARRCQARN